MPLPDDTPITKLGLSDEQIKRLTPATLKLTKGDLILLAHKTGDAATKNLVVEDLFSIEQAFRDFKPKYAMPNNVSCCTCTPCCSCSAAAVTR